MSIWSRMVDAITPGWLHEQAEQAEADLAATQQQLREVTERGKRVNRLNAAHTRDRRTNHYAERVAAAYAGQGD